jgi:di/tripeptidase
MEALLVSWNSKTSMRLALKLPFKGRNIHPGYAKDKMLNALLIAQEFNSLLPAHERPEHTQDYEGFYHLIKMDARWKKQHSNTLFATTTVKV